MSHAEGGSSGAATRRARRLKPGDGDVDPELDRDVVEVALSGATRALKQAAINQAAVAGALASQFLPAALQPRGLDADDGEDVGTLAGWAAGLGISPRAPPLSPHDDSEDGRPRSPWGTPSGASPGLRLGSLGPFDREELASASAAPSAELLALATAEGFGRNAAADVATRIADAFGVPAGALEPADCADLLLQALTEEKAQPGLLFIRRAPHRRSGAIAVAMHALSSAARNAAEMAVEAANRLRPAAKRRSGRSRRNRRNARPGVFSGDDGGACGPAALVAAAVAALLTCLAAAAAAGGGGAWAASHALRRVTLSPAWAAAPRCALYDAAAAGDVAAAKVYLRSRGADEFGDESKQAAALAASCGAGRGPRGLAAFAAALGAASAGGHVATVNALLDAGAPPDSGWRIGIAWAPLLTVSPLAAAVASRSVPQPLMASLLRRGASPMRGLRLGALAEVAPLALALAADNAPAAQALAAAGADPARCARLLWLWAACDDVAAASQGGGENEGAASRALRTARKAAAAAASRRGGAESAAEAAAKAAKEAAVVREAAEAEAVAARETARRRRETRRAESAAAADEMLRSADRAASAAAARAAEAERAEAAAMRAAEAAAQAALDAAEL